MPEKVDASFTSAIVPHEQEPGSSSHQNGLWHSLRFESPLFPRSGTHWKNLQWSRVPVDPWSQIAASWIHSYESRPTEVPPRGYKTFKQTLLSLIYLYFSCFGRFVRVGEPELEQRPKARSRLSSHQYGHSWFPSLKLGDSLAQSEAAGERRAAFASMECQCPPWCCLVLDSFEPSWTGCCSVSAERCLCF